MGSFKQGPLITGHHFEFSCCTTRVQFLLDMKDVSSPCVNLVFSYGRSHNQMRSWIFRNRRCNVSPRRKPNVISMLMVNLHSYHVQKMQRSRDVWDLIQFFSFTRSFIHSFSKSYLNVKGVKGLKDGKLLFSFSREIKQDFSQLCKLLIYILACLSKSFSSNISSV